MGTLRVACMHHAQTKVQKQLYILLSVGLIFFYTMSIFAYSQQISKDLKVEQWLFCFVQKMSITDIPGLWVIAQILRKGKKMLSSHKKFHYLVKDKKKICMDYGI